MTRTAGGSTAADAVARPLCADVSREAGESLGATASRVEHWLLVEYAGYWPFDPLDAAVFAGTLRDHLEAQLEALPASRLLLVKRPGRERDRPLRVVYGATRERGSRFFQLELDGHPDLLDLDVAGALTGGRERAGEPLDHPLLLVCTHGKRDRCCARYGQRVCARLHERAPAGWTWQSSHVGGDRFAGNVVCLPEGLYFGRLDGARTAAALTAYLAGQIELDSYRGRSCYPFAVQAAELHVRRRTGLKGIHDLRLLSSVRTERDRWNVELLAEVAGVVHELRVVETLGAATYLTCKALQPRRPRHFTVVDHAERPV